LAALEGCRKNHYATNRHKRTDHALGGIQRRSVKSTVRLIRKVLKFHQGLEYLRVLRKQTFFGGEAGKRGKKRKYLPGQTQGRGRREGERIETSADLCLVAAKRYLTGQEIKGCGGEAG